MYNRFNVTCLLSNTFFYSYRCIIAHRYWLPKCLFHVMFAIIHYIDNQYFQICLDFNNFDGHSDCLIFKKYLFIH